MAEEAFVHTMAKFFGVDLNQPSGEIDPSSPAGALRGLGWAFDFRFRPRFCVNKLVIDTVNFLPPGPFTKKGSSANVWWELDLRTLVAGSLPGDGNRRVAGEGFIRTYDNPVNVQFGRFDPNNSATSTPSMWDNYLTIDDQENIHGDAIAIVRFQLPDITKPATVSMSFR